MVSSLSLESLRAPTGGSHAAHVSQVVPVAHDASVRAAIDTAYARISFYGTKRPARTEVRAGAPLAEALEALPLLWKHQVRATLPKEWVPEGRNLKAELASGEIELVETSGSTAERTRILWDKGWWLHQEERGMRTNPTIDRAMADAARYREAILTTPVCGLGSCHTGDLPFEERLDEHRLFLNSRADPTFWSPADTTRMLDELERHRVVGLETDPTYLAALARAATKAGRKLAITDFVTLTYALTSAAHLRTAARAVTVPVYQLYGASEVGVLFMEGDDGLLHHCPLTTHVELLPLTVATPGAEEVALVVVTTLDRHVQPLVRFVVGDLVQVRSAGARRFTPVAPIASAEGRLQDVIIRPDGAWVTAGAFDRAFGTHPGVSLYQANQETPSEVVVDVVPDEAATGELEAELTERVRELLSGLKVTVRRVTAVAAESSGKFRLVRRKFTVDLGSAIPGGAGVLA